MKKHFNSIVTKFLLIAPILGFIGQIFNNMDLKTAMLTAVLITLGTYLSADLVLLPQYGNKIALVGDAVISTAIFWEMSSITPEAQVNFPGIFLAAALIVMGERYFHRYLLNISLRKKKANNTSTFINTNKNIKNKKSLKNNKKSK